MTQADIEAVVEPLLFDSSLSHLIFDPWSWHNPLLATVFIIFNKKAVLPQGNRAMPQVFFSVEVRQQHSLQV